MFTQLKHLAAMTACALLATTASAQGVTHAGGPSPAAPVQGEAPARLVVDPPIPGALATGVVVIRYRTENLRVLSVFGKAAAGVSPRIGHLHVTVDGAPWHFVDTSGEQIVVVGLAAGPHSVLLELADAAHRVLTSETVAFTLPALTAAKGHDE